jgi:predicted nucleotidyltransferase
MTEESEARKIAKKNLILMTQVGSESLGLNVPGHADRDLMGVCLEPPSHVIGLRHFEQDVMRDKPQGVRSEAGDTDSVVYSARKFCSLALKGNPSILTALFAPVIDANKYGFQLRDLAPAFASKRAGRAFLGYMVQQRERLMGERGQKEVNRPELVEQFGYDTKYAMHIVRLGYQGVQYMTTGKLILPIPSEDRGRIFNIRMGYYDLEEVLEIAAAHETVLERLLETSPLPDDPDHKRVEEWLIRAYTEYWEETE